MQVSEHVHALNIPFRIPFPDGNFLERFVYTFLIFGRNICVIDSGVNGSHGVIFDYIRKAGRSPQEINSLVITHAHPDHIGSAREIRNATGCTVYAHEKAVAWTQDVDLQFKERPVPGFHTLVSGSTKVDIKLNEGDTIEINPELSLDVYHTPGHSPDSISLFLKHDGVLITADLIPVPGTMPIYTDVPVALASMKRMKAISGTKVLLSSWDDPRHADNVQASFDNGMRFTQGVHDNVRRAASETGSKDPKTVALKVIEFLKLPPFANNPLFHTTVSAHLSIADTVSLT